MLILLLTFKYCACDYLYPPGIQTTPLPEIIINKNSHQPLPTSGNFPSAPGYYYPVPQPPNDILPPLQDEIPVVPVTPIDNGYLPPPNNYLPPNQQDFQPFQPAPVPVPHPVYGVPGTVPVAKQNGVDAQEPYVRVISMSCLDSADGRFFKAVLQSNDFIDTPPVFIKTTGNCNILRKNNDAFVISLEGVNIGNCGVKYCANRKLCLNLRLPTVHGLQLPEDKVVTLQCSPQHSIASVVRSLGIKTQKIQPRAIGFNAIASGGTQRSFRPHLALYRKGNQLVEPGSSVILGEELHLKASVNDNEEWKYAKIGSVIVQQGVQAGNDRKSVVLVDNEGCRVESMKAICPNHPEQLTNKMVVVPFRAFLFQDVEGDEMLLSVRLFACMHQKDCQQTKHCEEKAAPNALNTLGRRKRSAATGLNSTRVRASHYYSSGDAHNSSDTNDTSDTIDESVQDYESHLDFRVVVLGQYPNANQLKAETIAGNRQGMLGMNNYDYSGWSMDDFYDGYLFVSGVLIIGVTCVAILCLVVKVAKGNKMATYMRKY